MVRNDSKGAGVAGTRGGAPPATAAAPSLPAILPHSALIGAIQSPAVRAVLLEAHTLRTKRLEVRDRLREVQTHRDALLREAAGSTDVHKSKQVVDDLHREKNAQYNKLEQLRIQQDEIAQARSVLRLCNFDCSDLGRAVSDAALLLQSEEKELRRLRASREDPQKEKASEAQVQRYAEQLATKQAQKEAKEAEREAARQRLDALSSEKTPEERHDEYRQVSERISKVQAQIDAARGKQQVASKSTAEPIEQARREEAQLRETIRGLEERLDAIHAEVLPRQHFTYPPEYRSELIGAQGTTLCQLQLDFGVALCVDNVPLGSGFAIGSAEAMRDCVDAIDAIMEHAEQHSEKREITYDVAMRRHLIGPRGATIEKLERESGARVRLQGDGVVELTGTAGAIQKAQGLIDALLDSFSTGDMAFDPNRIGTVIGQGGSTIQRVEKECGLRGVRVDRTNNKIVFSGSADAIAKAKAFYRDLLGIHGDSAHGAAAVAETSATLHAEERVVRAVIGHRGTQVREIERTTGARIQCSGTTITVTGTAEAVAAATRKIDALRRAEARLPADTRMLAFLTSPSVLTTSADAENNNNNNSSSSGTATSARCSVLEAVKEAVGCDAVVPLRAEGCVIVRGSPSAVQQASMMLRQLMVRNRPSVVRMPYLGVLRAALLRREEGQSKRLLDQFCAGYSPLLHVELDRDRRQLLVSSFDADEVKAAATELKALLASLEHERVRVVTGVPMAKVGTLIGPQGATIRDLQSETRTEITVVREDAEIQIYHPDGDQDALEEAAQQVRTLLGLVSEHASDNEGDEEEAEATAEAPVGSA